MSKAKPVSALANIAQQITAATTAPATQTAAQKRAATIQAKKTAATEAAKQAAPVVAKIAGEVKAPVVKEKATKETKTAPAVTLHHAAMTPASHKELRAYFLGFIMAQLGGLVVNKPFKLWPSANVAGHVATGKVAKVAGGMYTLTTQGYNTFTDPTNARNPDKEMQANWINAIKTGEKPKGYNVAFYKMK